ncbi:hypothetical protein ACFW5V_32520 [Streptomyces sp. NPDC058762]|uniref:hypothetical protein n=1 Tax=Streptomyces sp. NPDC058762 TaxID=3346629 RepID=UPI00368A7077
MQDDIVETPWTAADVKKYHFRSLLLRRELHPPRNNDGITIRIWRLFGWGLVPAGLSLHLATLAPASDFGRRGQRAPKTWRRLLLLMWQDSGWIRHPYCPARPPQREGVSLRLPCFQIALNWSSFRPQARVARAHYLAPCAACEADGRRPAERDAT